MKEANLKKGNEIKDQITELKSIHNCITNKNKQYPYLTITYFGNTGPSIKQIRDELNKELIEIIKSRIISKINELDIEFKSL